MCYKIDSSFTLIHYLKNKNSCTIRDIVELKNRIENELKSVYVDVSKDSILQTISQYPEIFYWEENQIKKQKSAEKYFNNNVIDFFKSEQNSKIEDELIKFF
ncbi:MAG TPA: hypothetical protein PKG88_06995 [Bacteroidales bacterium]|nr:hypothetical protein [Bacteroidales bacterium]HPS72364.1 hypothetical protein [Bacteroidales bacterium]